jgi:1,5-anhydro-D-fructose reductase (1,5-anhydro-D-mannitol-forming)
VNTGNKPAVAFVGLGIMGHRMLTNMTTHGGFELARAWDPDPEACRIVAEQYKCIKIGDTAEQIINDPNIDVVYIASPPKSHKEYATAAARAGKVVFCEKPLGVDIPDSRSLVEEVEATGVPNAVNFPFVDSHGANKIQARLIDGTIGNVLGVDLRLHFSSWPRGWQHAASWLSERKEGGFIREVGSHYVFLTEKLFGPAKLIDATVRYQVEEHLCETHFLARLDCSGTPISFAGGSGGVGPDRVEYTVWGSKKSYRLWDWVNLKSTDGGDWVDELPDIEDPRQDGYRRVLDNFIRMLKGGEHSMAPLRAALTVQEIVEEILAR